MEKTISLLPCELSELIEHVNEMLPKLNEYNTLPNVEYDSHLAREEYERAANGLFDELGCSNEKIDCDKIINIFKLAKSDVARTAALNVYKKARAAIHDSRYSENVRNELFETLEVIKNQSRDLGAISDVVGNSDDLIKWIYSYENGPMVREVAVKSKKQGMKPLEIVQFTDVHFNYCNEKDMSEANPALMSTLEKRLWLRNAKSVITVRKAMDYAAMSDQTIVTGDIFDYLSWGAVELAQKEIFWRDTNLLACIGGHEITRVMQGTVSDESSRDSRFDMVKDFWCNDISYVSRVLGERVLAVVIDNGANVGYTEEQYNQLKSDIEYAKDNDLIILIFEHEGLCTSNPLDTDIEHIRKNDRNSTGDFATRFIGSEKTTDEWTLKTYALIRKNADVITGIFCGHHHSDFYTEILGTNENGEINGSIIPQYVLTANVYDDTGHVIKITID